MKLNNKIQIKTSQRKQRQLLEVRFFRLIRYKLEFIRIKTS